MQIPTFQKKLLTFSSKSELSHGLPNKKPTFTHGFTTVSPAPRAPEKAQHPHRRWRPVLHIRSHQGPAVQALLFAAGVGAVGRIEAAPEVGHSSGVRGVTS